LPITRNINKTLACLQPGQASHFGNNPFAKKKFVHRSLEKLYLDKNLQN